MGHRRKAREVALQVLYQVDVSRIDPEEAIELYWMNFDVAENVRDFASELIRGTRNHIREIDGLIKSCSEHWSLDRMARVDKNILRMAVFELLYCEDIPPKATLNEAIDLGKEYGSENSGSFINGILDAIYSKLKVGNED
ncbi:MAG: transcription antitermination factor NusB [Deltaproteobacteria bacterium]|nr:transcription antitermination factor NusB [Deltaproteobacteria bacterium]